MANTLTLQSSINFAQAFGGYKSLTVGTANEPAVTAANLILQTIVSPPFCWNFNRASASFLTVPGTQDYAEAVASFGFIEKAGYVPAASITNTSLTSNVATYIAANTFTAGQNVSVVGTQNDTGTFNILNKSIVSASGTQFTVAITSADIPSASDVGFATSGKITEIPGVQNVLGSGNESGAPNFVSPQIDDNRNNITFRVLPIPDQVYQINVIYQKRIPALMAGPTSSWAPIPDHYSYIYQWGFTAMMMAYFSDARWMSFSQKFVAALLGAAEGLEEEERNIFQSAWLSMISENQAKGLQTQQGVGARSAL